MALQNNQIPIYPILWKTGVGTIINATGAATLGVITNTVTIYTAGANGSIIDSLVANTTDTAANNIFLFIVGSDGTTVKALWQINVPLSSGNLASTLSVDCLLSTVAVGSLIDPNGKRYIRLGNSETLRAGTIAAVTAAKSLFITAQGGDF